MDFDSQNTPEETREDPYLSYEHRKQIEGITLWPHAEVKALYS
jgi:hypothetical protein